jgi:ATP-dependent protease ClpP protease subunit
MRPLTFLLFIAFSIFTNPAQAMIYQIDKLTNHSNHTLNVVHMSGEMDDKEWQRWTFEIQELDQQLDTLFILNSPGGNVPVGFFTIKKVEEFLAAQAKAKHKTWIAIDGQCASMCLPLFFTWPNRFALTASTIGLHGVSDGRLGYDADLTRSYLDNMREHARSRGETSALNWINQMVAEGEFSSPELTPHPVKEIANENGILTPDEIVDTLTQLVDRL